MFGIEGDSDAQIKTEPNFPADFDDSPSDPLRRMHHPLAVIHQEDDDDFISTPPEDKINAAGRILNALSHHL